MNVVEDMSETEPHDTGQFLVHSLRMKESFVMLDVSVDSTLVRIGFDVFICRLSLSGGFRFGLIICVLDALLRS